MRARLRPFALLAASLAGACEGDGGPELGLPPPQLADPVRVSGATPHAPGCNGAPQRGTRYANAEVEPSLAVDPSDPAHLVGAWQQDRWSSGGADGIVAGASFDGGRTWTRISVPFSRCGGGTPSNGGDYERATDPWVSFSADGAAVHQIALAFDVSDGVQAILVSRSTDLGLSWSDAKALASEASRDFALDKPSLTADPGRAEAVYAVWDRLTGLTGPDPAAMTGPAWFSRSLDGGITWEPPRAIHDPGADAQTIASQIVVLPSGALVNVFVRLTRASSAQPAAEIAAMRSADQGTTWSAPVAVAALLSVGAVDPKSGHPVRAGEVVPSTAVDPATGTLHVAWQDARFGGGERDGIVLASSTDGGATWSAPVPVNGAPTVQAFRPSIAVGSGGAIAVTYYDFRNDDPADPFRVWTTFWRATSADGGASWQEVAEGGPFDLRTAPDAGGWFLGDYTGLAAGGDSFVALFAMTSSGVAADPTDVFASERPSAGVLAAPTGIERVERNVHPVPLADRVRAMRELDRR